MCLSASDEKGKQRRVSATSCNTGVARVGRGLSTNRGVEYTLCSSGDAQPKGKRRRLRTSMIPSKRNRVHPCPRPPPSNPALLSCQGTATAACNEKEDRSHDRRQNARTQQGPSAASQYSHPAARRYGSDPTSVRLKSLLCPDTPVPDELDAESPTSTAIGRRTWGSCAGASSGKATTYFEEQLSEGYDEEYVDEYPMCEPWRMPPSILQSIDDNELLPVDDDHADDLVARDDYQLEEFSFSNTAHSAPSSPTPTAYSHDEVLPDDDNSDALFSRPHKPCPIFTTGARIRDGPRPLGGSMSQSIELSTPPYSPLPAFALPSATNVIPDQKGDVEIETREMARAELATDEALALSCERTAYCASLDETVEARAREYITRPRAQAFSGFTDSSSSTFRFSLRKRIRKGMDHSLRGFRGSRLSASMDEEDVKEADETLLNKALYSCAWKQENPLLTVVKNFPLSSKGFTAKQTEWLSNCITTRILCFTDEDFLKMMEPEAVENLAMLWDIALHPFYVHQLAQFRQQHAVTQYSARHPLFLSSISCMPSETSKPSGCQPEPLAAVTTSSLAAKANTVSSETSAQGSKLSMSMPEGILVQQSQAYASHRQRSNSLPPVEEPMGSCQSATLEACQKEDSELKRPCPMKELTPVLAPSTAIGKPGQLSASLPASPTLRQSPLGGHKAADERVDSVQLKVLNAVARKLNEGLALTGAEKSKPPRQSTPFSDFAAGRDDLVLLKPFDFEDMMTHTKLITERFYED